MSPLSTQRSALERAEPQAEPRRYEVKFHRDLRPDCPWHWRLYTYGPGHWCIGQGYAGAFQSETEAHQAGRKWLAEGKTK